MSQQIVGWLGGMRVDLIIFPNPWNVEIPTTPHPPKKYNIRACDSHEQIGYCSFSSRNLTTFSPRS
jgi:hypothetical protein